MVETACANPARWGRIDADGTVYLRTADGERVVGSWHAGDQQEGLAYYARKFDDLLTEVQVAQTRLTNSRDPQQTLNHARQLRESVSQAAVIGDVFGLAAHLDMLIAQAEQAIAEGKQAEAKAREESIAHRQKLVTEAKKLSESIQWKSAGERLKTITEEWKTTSGIDHRTDQKLWQRFVQARNAFNRRRAAHFAELDQQRTQAQSRKETIVAQAEKLADSTDWKTTAAHFKQLMNDWKTMGRAPKNLDEKLWQQFRAAQDQFYSRRDEAFHRRDVELADNARKKDELLAEVERLDLTTDAQAARAQLGQIRQRWDNIGHVPRERIREYEDRLKTAQDKVNNTDKARSANAEMLARLRQFQERAEQFETQAAKARAAGNEKQAEEAEARAAQWREWLSTAEQASQKKN